jgi:hypothetical protein
MFIYVLINPVIFHKNSLLSKYNISYIYKDVSQV